MENEISREKLRELSRKVKFYTHVSQKLEITSFYYMVEDVFLIVNRRKNYREVND